MAGNEKKVFDRDEIEKRLNNIAKTNRAGVVVFAARQALRVLPVYYSENNLFRDTSKGFYPYAVWWCCYLVFNLYSGRIVVVVADADAYAYAAARADAAARAAADADAYAAARAAAYAAYAAADAYAADADAAYAAAAAAYADAYDNKLFIDSVYSDLEVLEKGGDLARLPLWRTASPPEFFADPFSNFEDYFIGQGWVEEIQDSMAMIGGDLDSGSFERNFPVYHERFEALKKQFENRQTETETETETTESNSKPFIIYQAGTQFTSEAASNQDYLNREPIAKALANWLMDKANKNHITIGLFGDWGMGKSTFVELIKNQLILANNVKQTHPETDDTQFIVAEFNAWKYERSSNIQAGLAHEVVGGLLKGLPWYLKLALTFKYTWAKHKFKLIRLVVVLLAILIFGIVASQQISDEEKIILWGIDIAAMALVARDQGKKLLAHPLAKELKTYLRLPHFGEHLGTIPVMREQLETLIKLRLEHSHRDMHAGFFLRKKLDNQRFLLVVDDLDRCSHEGVVKTFEAVRLVMDLPNVVVIIAIDQRIALASLALHYQDISKHHQADPISIARDYLGKVIHLPITLEEPAADDVEKFLRNEWQKVGDIKSAKESQDIESIIKPKTVDVSIDDSNGQPNINQTRQFEVNSKNSNSDNLENSSSDKPEKIQPIPDPPLEKLAENHQKTLPDDLQIAESSYQKGLSKQQEKLFIEWVKRLNISNPRRLKRLTNAYALIRHCFVAEDSVDKSQEEQKPYSRLVMLIWLEYVNELNRNQRAQVLEVFRLKDIPELKLEKINDDIKQHLSEMRDYVGMENIELIYNQVKNFVLPAIDGVDEVVATPESMSW